MIPLFQLKPRSSSNTNTNTNAVLHADQLLVSSMSEKDPPASINHDHVHVATLHPDEHLPHAQEHIPHVHEHEPLFSNYTLYRRRWFMLAIFCALTLSNGMMWITFSPISTYVEKYYNVNNFWVNMLSLVYMILYIPFVFLSSWIIDQRGLKFGVIAGALLNCVGAWVRCIPGHFAYVMLGQSINSIAQTFLLSGPVKLSANWFGHNERTTATSIGALSNQLGVAVGFYLPSAVATSPSKIPELLIIQAIMTSVILILVLAGFRTSVPPTPPSRTAATEKTQFFHGLRSALKEWPFWVLLIGFGLALGVFYDLCTLLNQFLEPFDYSQSDTGTLGSIILFVGLAGAIVAGPVLDTTKAYRLLSTLTFVGFLGGLAWFAFALQKDNFWSLVCCCGFIGFFATAMLPVCLEAGVECTFPVAEALSSGLLLMFGQIFGIIATLVLSAIQTHYNTRLAVYIQMGLAGLSLIIMLFFKTKYKRQEAEKLQKALA